MTTRRRGPLGHLLVATIVALALGGLICGGAPGALAPLPRDLEPLRGHLTMVGVILLEALVVAFALLPGIATRGRDDEHYEDLADDRGLELAAGGWFGRLLRGRVDGRRVQAFVAMGRHSPFANTGQLRVYVSAAAGRRVHLTDRAHQGLVADLTLGLNLLRLPAEHGLAGLARDAAGARAWLARPGVVEAVRRLLHWPGDMVVLLRVEPDAVSLTVHGAGAHTWDGARLDAVIADLATLGAALEAIGAPAPPEPAWPAEHRMQHDPAAQRRGGALTCLGCAGCAGLLFVLTAGLALAGLLPT